MKRYVTEFAKDEMKCCTEERKAKIQHILKNYERGLITSFEAVKTICDTYYETVEEEDSDNVVEIRIDTTGNGTEWLYQSDEWKEHVGCEDFDEEVVLFGNRDFYTCENASWYKETEEILTDIDCYGAYPANLSNEKIEKIAELYKNCRCTKDIIFDVIKLLYPNDIFKSGTIRDCVQREWQNYIVKGNVDTDLLEAFYFGSVVDINVYDNGDSFGDVITHDELWKAEREGLKEYMRKRYEISEDKEILILQTDGMKQTVDWKEVS